MPSSNMSRVFGGSTVLLTGAASGIGRALALLLSKCGATVHALDMNADGLDSLVSEAGAIHSYPVDITDYEAYSKVVTEILESSDGIDFLFNNAGVTLLGAADGPTFQAVEMGDRY